MKKQNRSLEGLSNSQAVLGSEWAGAEAGSTNWSSTTATVLAPRARLETWGWPLRRAPGHGAGQRELIQGDKCTTRSQLVMNASLRLDLARGLSRALIFQVRGQTPCWLWLWTPVAVTKQTRVGCSDWIFNLDHHTQTTCTVKALAIFCVNIPQDERLWH